MPFVKVDPIAEAIELQEMFKDDPDTQEMFRQYEASHRENKKLEQEEKDLKNRLVELRKMKNITQKELEDRTGLTQQAISRFENGNGSNIRIILKYAEGIDCRLIPQDKFSVV
ncbi:MAG: helix-turn-helix domain-containing protein [Clostridiales bacterium]|jgi:DNA-binding XRE family transcriptional regulator|nr:helix-turn-helix domain-containing protein [Clostridiales bacterium]